MTELKMVEACPVCDSSQIRYRVRTNEYYCKECETISKESIIRQRKELPRLPQLPGIEPPEQVDGIQMFRACPVCDGVQLRYRKMTKDFYCTNCKTVCSDPVIRKPKIIRNLPDIKPLDQDNIIPTFRVCPVCDHSKIHYRKMTRDFRCDSCGSIFVEPRIRQTYVRPRRIACLNCGSHNMKFYKGVVNRGIMQWNKTDGKGSKKAYYRCSHCGKTFVLNVQVEQAKQTRIKQKHPKPPQIISLSSKRGKHTPEEQAEQKRQARRVKQAAIRQAKFDEAKAA